LPLAARFSVTDDSMQSIYNQLSGIGAGVLQTWALLSLGFLILWIVIFWRLAAKAGYNGALSLLLLIPFFNFFIFFIFALIMAFSEWPVERRLKALTGGTTTALPPSV
jgi:hypothetical protein